MINRKLAAAVAGIALIGAVLTACGAQLNNDSAVQGPPTGDKIPAEIYSMPDKFNNFALKCVHGIYWGTIYHGGEQDAGLPYGAFAGVPALPGDPNCPAPAAR